MDSFHCRVMPLVSIVSAPNLDLHSPMSEMRGDAPVRPAHWRRISKSLTLVGLSARDKALLEMGTVGMHFPRALCPHLLLSLLTVSVSTTPTATTGNSRRSQRHALQCSHPLPNYVRARCRNVAEALRSHTPVSGRERLKKQPSGLPSLQQQTISIPSVLVVPVPWVATLGGPGVFNLHSHWALPDHYPFPLSPHLWKCSLPFAAVCFCCML